MSDVKAAAATPLPAKIVSRQADGSALVEVPVTRVANVDQALTEGGGDKVLKFKRAELDEMVSNFAVWGQPVSVGFDGIDGGHKRDKGGPQRAFVQGVRRHDDILYAVVELSPFGAMLVVDEKAYRAFSMEAVKSPKTASAEFSGWVLTGGTFTNTNAVDTVYKIAASAYRHGVQAAEGGVSLSSEFTLESPSPVPTPVTPTPAQAVSAARVGPQGGSTMSETTTPTPAPTPEPQASVVSVAFHNSTVGTLRDQITAIGNELAVARAELAAAATKVAKSDADAKSAIQAANAERDTALAAANAARDEKATALAAKGRLEIELRAATQSQVQTAAELGEARVRLQKIEGEVVGQKVRELVLKAIDAKVPPVLFDGWDKDPAAWLASKYVNFEAFESSVKSLVSTVSGAAGSVFARSGHDPKDGATDTAVELKAEEKAHFEQRGLGTEFVGVTTESEARKRHEAMLASKKK